MEDGVDRISKLPDSLKEIILDCLHIKDAVRTSILSSEWRYTWTFRKRLDFSQIFSRFIGIHTPETYPRIIDRILIMHHGPIEYVSLCIPQGFWEEKIDSNAWLLNVSRKGIQELEIKAFNYRRSVEFFTLPSCLFLCQSLRYLKLGHCALKPPSNFCGFFNLVTLHLRHVRMLSDSLGTFISRCTQLENLYIMFDYPDFRNRSQPLIINAPNLRNLELWDHTPGTIILQNVPLLNALSRRHSSDMHLYTSEHLSSMYSSCNLLSWLGKIEKLDCDLSLLEHLNGDCPDKLPMLLMNLKILRFNFFIIFKPEEIASLFCLLRSAPSLKTLHIEICQESFYSETALVFCLGGLEVEERKTNNFKSLMNINVVLIREWYPWKSTYVEIHQDFTIQLPSPEDFIRCTQLWERT